MSRVRFPQAVAELVTKYRSSPIATNVMQKETRKVASEAILPSLGASGAIYGTVTLTALAFPDTQVALIFPPTWPIPIQWGVGGLVALDILGALRGWKIFDHYAHLGGAAFGAWYYSYGPGIWNACRLLDMPISKPTTSAERS
ncbi:hypothetical protein EIP86_005537 [Pleurotus ostreatoroseus]|nr:hypothetical protein EIP86_005537 [Pleurotus ostreatoroseus]